MNKVYYKVLSRDMKSPITKYWYRPDYTVQYIPDEFVKAKLFNSKLFVFDDLEHALTFAFHDHETLNEYEREEKIKLGSDLEYVWECEVKNPAKENFNVSMMDLDEFWRTANKKLLKPSIYGTVAVDEVKITKRVGRELV